jgi:hypothetical protein
VVVLIFQDIITAASSIRLLKNTHLLRYAHPSSLRRTGKYASFLRISRALRLDVFDQPEKNYFINNLLVPLLLSGNLSLNTG